MKFICKNCKKEFDVPPPMDFLMAKVTDPVCSPKCGQEYLVKIGEKDGVTISKRNS